MRKIKVFLLLIASLLSANLVFAEMRSSITQYGITWTFDSQYECGQFITGDWWVVGPVTINSVSPTPTSTRNGSCLNPSPWREGYDNRVPYGAYDSIDQVTFPHTFQANQSLVSSISKPEGVEVQNIGVMVAQAVLTIVDASLPPNTFRPSYCGTYKKYFNTGQLQIDLLPAVTPPASKPDVSEIKPFFDMPRIDHVNKWTMQWACAEQNWTNGPVTGYDHPCYSRGLSDLLSYASLYIMLDVSDKTELVYNLVQLGIDNYGVLKAGGAWYADGGHMNARKFPIVLAAVLLNDPDMLAVGADYWGKFGTDKQTYYGVNNVALWGNDCNNPDEYYTCKSGKKDCRDPEGLVDGCPTYIDGPTSSTWVGQALAALMLDAKPVWNHDAFFDYVDRWRAGEVPPAYTGYTSGAFVTDMWDLYRNNLTGEETGIEVTSVAVSPTNLTLDEGQSFILTATVLPDNATDPSITWSTSNPSVATVDVNGLVTAVMEGDAVITATTNDGSYTATSNVTINALTDNLALNKPITVSDYQDDSLGNKPGENLVDGDVSDDARWSASGFPQWAEIDLGNDYDLNRIDLYPYQNRAYQYIVEAKTSVGSYATIIDRSANTESADVLIDNVNSTARYIKITVSGLSGSTSTWTSLSELKVYGTLSNSVFVTGVNLSASTLDISEGQTSTLTASISPANATDQTVTWSSSDTSIATVDASGLVTAVAVGNCTITVTTNDGGHTTSCLVTVLEASQSRIESITASNDDREIRSNESGQWVGQETHRIGGVGAGYDGVSIHPFQLPALTDNEIILSASMRVNLKKVANTPGSTVDMYGLPYRSTSVVSITGDYWQGAYGADPNATPIQDSFATNSSPSGYIVTNTNGNSNLTDYVNAQYSAGAQGGDYVFIRLNPNENDVADYNYWEFYSANSSYKPILELEIGNAPYLYLEQDNAELTNIDNGFSKSSSVKIWPNPLDEFSSLTISLTGFEINTSINLKIIDVCGKTVYSANNLKTDENGNRVIILQTNHLMKKGIYLLYIINNSEIHTKQISIQ